MEEARASDKKLCSCCRFGSAGRSPLALLDGAITDFVFSDGHTVLIIENDGLGSRGTCLVGPYFRDKVSHLDLFVNDEGALYIAPSNRWTWPFFVRPRSSTRFRHAASQCLPPRISSAQFSMVLVCKGDCTLDLFPAHSFEQAWDVDINVSEVR